MNHITTQDITLLDPEGVEHTVTVKVRWSPFERNPCDKDPAHYRGEDDGRVIQSIQRGE